MAAPLTHPQFQAKALGQEPRCPRGKATTVPTPRRVLRPSLSCPIWLLPEGKGLSLGASSSPVTRARAGFCRQLPHLASGGGRGVPGMDWGPMWLEQGLGSRARNDTRHLYITEGGV